MQEQGRAAEHILLLPCLLWGLVWGVFLEGLGVFDSWRLKKAEGLWETGIWNIAWILQGIFDLFLQQKK